MVKISELANDGSVTGTEQVPLNDGGTTKKATTQNIANLANIPSSQVTDFNTAVDARINVPTDTAKTTPVDTDVFALWDTIRKKVTWSNIKATLKTYFDTLYHTKNALRTGLTATRLLLTDGSGNEGYLAGGSAGQFLNHAFTFATPTITPGIAILQGTRAINTTTGTQNIAHGLGVIPKYVYITANHSAGSSFPDIIYSHGFSDFTTNRCTYYGKQGNGSGYNPSIGNQSNCIYIRDTNSSGSGEHQTQVANITADATNIVLNRTYSVASSSMTTNINFTILCFA